MRIKGTSYFLQRILFVFPSETNSFFFPLCHRGENESRGKKIVQSQPSPKDETGGHQMADRFIENSIMNVLMFQSFKPLNSNADFFLQA